MPFSHLAGDLQQPQPNDLETLALEPGQHLADKPTLDAIGLDQAPGPPHRLPGAQPAAAAAARPGSATAVAMARPTAVARHRPPRPLRRCAPSAASPLRAGWWRPAPLPR